jgi:hypothetical protein
VDVLFAQAVEADKTRLLVLEDCDELLSVDAKLRAGQGLARLLNLQPRIGFERQTLMPNA